jgi:hypothetical protein
VAADNGGTEIPGQLEGLVQCHCAFRPVGDWYEDYSHIGDSFRGSACMPDSGISPGCRRSAHYY